MSSVFVQFKRWVFLTLFVTFVCFFALSFIFGLLVKMNGK